MLRRAVRKVGAAIWGLPGNIHFWWTVGIPAVPTILAWSIAFAREASWGQMLLIVVGTYLLLLITTALMLRRTATAKSQPLRTNQSKEPPTSELSDEDLREHCCELSAEIREFYKRQ